LAALITPVLDVQPDCLNASIAYIEALNKAEIWALMSELFPLRGSVAGVFVAHVHT
jgi:hypothetical protein